MTLAYVGRLIMQPIPNVQPVTAILIIITLCMGTLDGILVAIGSMFISNIFMGMGPWTLAQILTFILIILLTRWIIRPFYRENSWPNRIIIAIWSMLSGFLYGFIISIMMVKMYQINHFWAYYLRGIPFDFLHGIGNLIFYLLLEPILVPLIQRYFKE